MFQTKLRAQEVDFSLPFLNVHASMIMKKPKNRGPFGVNKVDDLLNREDLQYGTLDRGIIKKSLKASNRTLFKVLLDRMDSFKPKAHTKSNAEGIERVRRDGDYVFILPDVIGKYVASKRPCDLRVRDKFLMKEGFSLAVTKNSHLLRYLDQTIKTLHSNGFIDKIYKKWWIDRSECDGRVQIRDQEEVLPQEQPYRNSSTVNHSVIAINSLTILCLLFLILK